MVVYLGGGGGVRTEKTTQKNGGLLYLLSLRGLVRTRWAEFRGEGNIRENRFKRGGLQRQRNEVKKWATDEDG
jgi:hypothetical protein